MSLVFITGASRGFGRAAAVAFAKNAEKASHFIITGRNLSDLETTQQLINKASPTIAHTVTSKAFDLTDMISLDSNVESFFSVDVSDTKFDKIYFINNAGTLGPLAPVGSSALTSTEMISAFNTNLTAAFSFTNDIVRRFVFESSHSPSFIHTLHTFLGTRPVYSLPRASN